MNATSNGNPTGDISYMNEGIIEGGVNVSYSEDELSFPSLRSEGHYGLFLLSLSLTSGSHYPRLKNKIDMRAYLQENEFRDTTNMQIISFGIN